MPQSFAEFLCDCLTDDRLARFDEVLDLRTRHLTVVLENVYHTHNASACLRTCDCFGVQDVHIIEARNELDPSPDVALGASKWLTLYKYGSDDDIPYRQHKEGSKATSQCLRSLKAQGYRVLVTSPRQNSRPISDVEIDERTAIVFGAEQIGVTETAIAEADETVHIPMHGFTESFNISVAVAIVLHQLTTKLHRSQISWQLTAAEREVIHHQWVCRSLGAKLTPLRKRYQAEQS